MPEENTSHKKGEQRYHGRQRRRRRSGFFSLPPPRILALVIFVVLLAASPLSTKKSCNGRKWFLQQHQSFLPVVAGLVGSWTPPRTRTRKGAKQPYLPWLERKRDFFYRNEELPPLTRFAAVVASPPSTTTASEKTPPRPDPLGDRIAAVVEFVDNTLLFESSSKPKIESVLERVQREHNADFEMAKTSCLEVEEQEVGTTGISRSPSLSFEKIEYSLSPRGEQDLNRAANPTLAIRSNEPVLSKSSVDAVLEAAEDVWRTEKEDETGGTSRFTYQYSGNSEAHVFDFVTSTAPTTTINFSASDITTSTTTESSAGQQAVSALNEALQQKIYPMIREAFVRSDHDTDHYHRTKLFVYDALVIRYNSTTAAEAAEASGEAFASAGQPLHRDMGLVSVNIMLNSPEEFDGGGTFFENQLLDEGDETTPTTKSASTTTIARTVQPLKPSGVGYCLAHPASERHAGAGTTTGVRDILVLFVSAVTTGSKLSSSPYNAPAELLSARLKTCRSFCEQKAFEKTPESEREWKNAQRSALLCRILHQRLAVTAGPLGAISPSMLCQGDDKAAYVDGEALQYLGTALMEYSGLLSTENRPSEARSILEEASKCFAITSLVTPNDSRVYNNLGIVLGTIGEMMERTPHGDESSNGENALARRNLKEQQETAYKKGLRILEWTIEAGCTNESLRRDLESLSLNYGLFVANQDRFLEAAEILETVAVASGTGDKSASTSGVGRDAHKLWNYCLEEERRRRARQEPVR